MSQTPEEIARELLEQAGVGTTEKMGKGNRMKVGKHRLALLNLGFVKNMKTKDKRIQAEFEILESTTYEAGTKASLSFFVQRNNFPEYEVSRFQDMMAAIQQSLGDGRAQADVGADCMTHKGRGIILSLEVTEDLDENGQVQRGKTGSVYTIETWTPVPQTWDNVASARAELDAAHGAWKSLGERASNRPTQQTYATQPQIAAPQQAAPPAGPAPGAQFMQGTPVVAPPASGSLLRRPGQ